MRSIRTLLITLAMALAAAAGLATPAPASPFPGKQPIEMTVLFPAGSSADVIAAAKAKPDTLTIANSGAGSHTHISAVALFHSAGVQMVDVPFGAAQVVTSLVQGEVDAAVQLPAALAEDVKVGQVRLLATLPSNRDLAFPDTPTAREQGIDVSLEAWRGVAVPKGTPKPIIATLEAAIRKTVASQEFAQACTPLGVRPAYLPSDAFRGRIEREDRELARLIEIIGLKKP